MSRHRALTATGIAVLAIIVCFVLWWRASWARYRLPDVNDVASMTATFYDRNHTQEEYFPVDKSCWKDVFSALSPWKHDPSPAKWQVLGCLIIETNDGKTCCVSLYDLTPDPIGAFSVKPDVKNRPYYYRGGNSMRLRESLAKALAKFEKEHQRVSPKKADRD